MRQGDTVQIIIKGKKFVKGIVYRESELKNIFTGNPYYTSKREFITITTKEANPEACIRGMRSNKQFYDPEHVYGTRMVLIEKYK